RPHSCLKCRTNRALHFIRRILLPELLEHESAREHGRHRIRDSFAHKRRRRAMYGFEEPWAAGMEIGAGRESQTPDQPSPKIREDIAIEVIGHDHLEALRGP